MPAFEGTLGTGARVEVTTVPVPRDCVDGFLGAFWARPAAYLSAQVRAGISSFSQPGVERGLERLAADLATGAWHDRYGDLLDRDALDLGYRLVVAQLPDVRADNWLERTSGLMPVYARSGEGGFFQ